MKKQDDKSSEHKCTTEISLRPWDACAPDVARALQCFVDEITISLPSPHEGRGRKESYSLTSRSPSLWALLRRHLKVPLAEAIHSYQGPWAHKLLTGFCLSAVGRYPPKWRIDHVAWGASRRQGDPIAWDGLVVPVSRPISESRQKISDADQVLDNISAWDENLRFVIRSSDAPLPNNVSINAHLQFCATLDTIRSLLGALHDYRPQIGRDPLNAHEGARPRLPDAATRRQSGGYCELCWRHTMRAAAMSGQNVPGIKARQLSDRFCSEHNPSDSLSRYRADQRYKEAFQRELMVLQGRGGKSAFDVQFELPRTADVQEIRKAAYDQVHARLRPLSRLENPSLRESAWLLYQQGMRQVEVARQLGTSRQSVFRAIKSTEKLLRTRQQEEMLNSSSGESWEKSENSLFVQSVASFYQDGYTVGQIARITGRFRHTVLTVLRWLETTSLASAGDVEFWH